MLAPAWRKRGVSYFQLLVICIFISYESMKRQTIKLEPLLL